MSKISSIVIDRAEGPSDLCGERTFTTLKEAEAFLKEAAQTAPDTGGYDKCDFTIKWADGEVYSGRADIQRKHSITGYSLKAHITDFISFVGGWSRPDHLTPAQYASYLKTFPENYGDLCREFLKNYIEPMV